jgi:hypothetical protein
VAGADAMDRPDEIDSMLTELDRQPAPAPAPAPVKLPQPDATYALPGAPDRSQPRARRKPTRSNTWVQRVTGEDLVAQTKEKAKKCCCGRVTVPRVPTAWVRFAKILSPLLAIGALTAVGNVAYALLEADTEREQDAAYRAFLNDLLATTNITAKQFETLLSHTGKEHDPLDDGAEFFDTERIGGAAEHAGWGFPNYQTFYFSFSIISTIGYGSIVPSTGGGKLFTVIYALIGIPFCVTAVSICAAEVLYLFEWLAVSRMDQVRIAFQSYDTDSSNTLDMDEFREALSDLGIQPSEEDFQSLVDEIDEDESHTLDLDEFKLAVTILKLPIGRVARTKVRLQISVVVSVLWLFLGMFMIGHIEGWTYLDSFYFSVMTLTTVGLGDFVPASRQGIVFAFFYCMVGLGLIALLVTAIGEFSEAVKNKAEQKAAAAVVSAATRAANAKQAVGRKSDKLLRKSPLRHTGPVGGEDDPRSLLPVMQRLTNEPPTRMDGTAVVR